MCGEGEFQWKEEDGCTYGAGVASALRRRRHRPCPSWRAVFRWVFTQEKKVNNNGKIQGEMGDEKGERKERGKEVKNDDE